MSGIKFGNLTVKQFGERVGTKFTDEELTILESSRSENATVDEYGDNFHIFEDPAISIDFGVFALKKLLPIFKAANDRKPFNRKVFFCYSPKAEKQLDDYANSQEASK